MLPRLTIAIATMGVRAKNIQMPEPCCGVEYYVGIQCPEEVPRSITARADVRIEKLDTVGLSASRNAAIRTCSTELMLLADDDLIFNMEGIEEARRAFATDASLDILTGRLVDPGGEPLKPYPDLPGRWSRWSCGGVGSPEMMMRMSSVVDLELSFDERFGLGAAYPSGEEYIFILDALRRGAVVRHGPHVLAEHPAESTGTNWIDPRLVDARGAVMVRGWGPVAGRAMRSVYAIRKCRRIGLRNSLRMALGVRVAR